MKPREKTTMSPAAYFGTGVAVGLFIGVITGFLTHSILFEDAGTDDLPRGIDTSIEELSNRSSEENWQRDGRLIDDRQDRAHDATPAQVNDDGARTHEEQTDGSDAPNANTPNTNTPTPAQNDALPSAPSNAAADDGLRDLDNWPDAADDGASTEDEFEERPTPGGGRLSQDPSVPYNPPEE